MKKLSIIFGFALVLGLMAGSAMAQVFDVDADGHPGTIGAAINVDVWVRGMAGTDLWGMDFDVTYNPAELTLVSVTVNDTASGLGGCLASAFTITSDTGPGLIYIGGGKMPGTTCPFAGGEYMLVNLQFTTVTTGPTQVCAGGVGDPTDGWVQDDTGMQFPAPMCDPMFGVPCTTVISPDPASVMAAQAVQFTFANTGTCANPANIMWVDTCALGDVDGTGLLTTVMDLVGETCQICAVDLANTDSCNEAGSNCCSDVTIYSGW